MKTVINGIELNYERAGEGKPVLLLHGWGASVDTMRPIAKHLLSRGRCVVMLDFPGFGKSQPPNAVWGVEDFAEITKKFIEQQEIAGCDVIGHSHGGRVTIYLASQYSELFDKLVLLDAAGVKPRRKLSYYFKVYSYKLAKRLAKIKLFDRLFGLSARIRSAGSEDYKVLSGEMRATFVKVVNRDLTPVLKLIKNPTLLVWGSEDKDTPLYMAKIMEKQIPNAGLAVLNGAGHYSYLDAYHRFCAILDALFFPGEKTEED